MKTFAWKGMGGYLLITHNISKLLSVQFSCSVAKSCLTLCNPMDYSTPGLPVCHQLPEFTQTHVHWVNDAIQPSCPFLVPPSIFPSIRVFSNESALRISGQSIGVSATTSVPFNEHPGLISFRRDWLDLLAVQGTLKSLLQHHSSKASVLQGSAFFIVQLSHPYLTTGKTIALSRRTFVGKVMSLLFKITLCRHKRKWFLKSNFFSYFCNLSYFFLISL